MIVTVTLNPSLDEWVYLDRLVVGALNRSRAFGRYPGGKGINVARVVHELGERTLAIALAGGDDGKSLSHLLTGLHLRHQFVTVPGTTRNNYQIQSSSPKALTQINCPGPDASARALTALARLLDRRTPHASCVVISGSLPPGAPTTTYQAYIRRLRRSGVPAVLDTSGRALADGLWAQPWLIKPNRQEAEDLLGTTLARTTDVARSARELVSRGLAHVIISLGAEGAVLAAKDQPQVLFATPPKVRVQSTVGSGDSMVAGFVVGWFRTRSLTEAFRLGSACGAASVMTPGTELCHRRDVARLLGRVKIREIS